MVWNGLVIFRFFSVGFIYFTALFWGFFHFSGPGEEGQPGLHHWFRAGEKVSRSALPPAHSLQRQQKSHRNRALRLHQHPQGNRYVRINVYGQSLSSNGLIVIELTSFFVFRFFSEQSRRDDLEALGYVLMYFQRGSLPWQGLKANTKRQKYEKIAERKIGTPVEELCAGYPCKLFSFLYPGFHGLSWVFCLFSHQIGVTFYCVRSGVHDVPGLLSEDWFRRQTGLPVRTHVHTYTRTYVHTYTRTHVHTYTRTHVHTCTPSHWSNNTWLRSLPCEIFFPFPGTCVRCSAPCFTRTDTPTITSSTGVLRKWVTHSAFTISENDSAKENVLDETVFVRHFLLNKSKTKNSWCGASERSHWHSTRRIQLIDRLIGWLFIWLIDWLFDWSIDWPIDWMTVQLTLWLIVRSILWSIDHLCKFFSTKAYGAKLY